ncbi:Two-component response regulator [Granulibacter bethesdensis]|nr:Two-component response regulator [Granulibacter bethesdensis]
MRGRVESAEQSSAWHRGGSSYAGCSRAEGNSGMTQPMIKVLVVEDHPLVRAGCHRVLSRRDTLEVLEASSGQDGVAINAAQKPHVIILDINLPDSNGFDLLDDLLSDNPDVRIIVLSMYGDTHFVRRALDRGVKGYVTKNDDPETILLAIDQVMNNGVYLGQVVAQSLALGRLMPDSNVAAELSVKEKRVLELLGDGLSLSEIAYELGVSYKTVANMSGALRTRLKIRTGAALVKFAVEWKARTQP